MARKGELESRGEDAHGGRLAIVHIDDLAEADRRGVALAALGCHSEAVEHHTERIAAGAGGIAEHAQHVQVGHRCRVCPIGGGNAKMLQIVVLRGGLLPCPPSAESPPPCGGERGNQWPGFSRAWGESPASPPV